jgi:plasmid maintenance system killer protein
MQSILNIKLKMEEQAKMQFAQAQAKVNEEEAKLLKLKNRKSAYEQNLKELLLKKLDLLKIDEGDYIFDAAENRIRPRTPNDPPVNNYDIVNDLTSNAFALRINENYGISYRYLIRDCDAENGFSIEEETKNGAINSARLLEAVSAERIATELLRMLSGEHLEKTKDFFECGMLAFLGLKGCDIKKIANLETLLQKTSSI